MRKLNLWQQKLIQLLHDPPGKPFYFKGIPGGHQAVAAECFEATAGAPLKFYQQAPDQAASGADRPVTTPPSRPEGVSPISIDWPAHAILTHPLASGKAGSNAIHLGDMQNLRGEAQAQALAAAVRASLENVVHRESETQMLADEEQRRRDHLQQDELGKKLSCWNDADRLQELCIQLWRRMPNSGPPDVPQVVWQLQPADSRAPDHSLWDHVRIASALAFMTDRKNEGGALPWFVSFSIGPVQSFIGQSRTSSDLWTSSMLLSDLVWHAMQSFVERYGPEAIVYPDLRGNPRADLWIYQQQHEKRWHDVLPPDANPCSYAGIFPNTFIAIVPRGDDEGALERLQVVTAEAKSNVERRWRDLAKLAKGYFLNQAAPLQPKGREVFDRIWDRQHEPQRILTTSWTAAAWPAIEEVKNAGTLLVRQGLPAQSPPPDIDENDRNALETWRDRHLPWISSEAFAKYAEARYVYAKTNLAMHQSQRGFDYVLIHHALQIRHAIRKGEAQGSPITDEFGEKCTLCGLRQALTDQSADYAPIDTQREAVRAFWERFDRNSEGGAERLCAVCTMKRYLVRAGVPSRQDKDTTAISTHGLTAAWAGPNTPIDEVLDDDNELRVPFPSMATMAAQNYLCTVVTREDLSPFVAEVVRCCERANLPRTTFVRALRSIAEVSEKTDSMGRRFLEYEAGLTAFPEALASYISRAAQGESKEVQRGALRDKDGRAIQRDKLEELHNAVKKLRTEAQKGPNKQTPGTQMAMVAIDGDGIRKLLLGTKVGARWRDVIHPDIVKALEDDDVTKNAGWPTLLDANRLMGPSTHAFINRVLASFVHDIVPWVVEREFSGRLIYAGGDDVLALVPAAEALDMCGRLAQLYSAGWVIDTQPNENAWDWRKRNASITKTETARERFVAVMPNQNERPLPWPIPREQRSTPVMKWLDSPRVGVEVSANEALLPMMGTGQTLSAGIVIGHYKTPLGGLVNGAWAERERAKGKNESARPANGNACSIRRMSRSGEKARLLFSWGEPEKPDMALERYLQIKRVINAFANRELPGRLPYKLREVQEAIIASWRHELESSRTENTDNDATPEEPIIKVKKFAEGMFHTQVAKAPEGTFEVWWEGLLDDLAEDDALRRKLDGKNHRSEPNAEQGLALCRFLGMLARGEMEETP